MACPIGGSNTFHCGLKRPENLTERQVVKLSESQRTNLKTVHAYLMREDFQRFWEYNRASSAGRFLDRWCQRAMPAMELGGVR